MIFKKPRSDFDQKVNEASVYLSMKNPSLVRKGNRGELMEAARKKVVEDGYVFKKGRTRSKLYGVQDSQTTLPKRTKLNEESRRKRMDDLEDDIKDLSKRITMKEKRCTQAEASHSYKLCDELTEQISELKQEKRIKEKEFSLILRKDKRSKRYKENVQSGSLSSASSSRSSTSPSPFSPPSVPLSHFRCSTPSSPHSSRLSTIDDSSSEPDVLSSDTGQGL